MTRLLFLIAVSLLSLAACGGGVAEKGASPPAEARDSATGEEVVALFPTPIEEPVPEEQAFQGARFAPPPAGDPMAGEKMFARACATCHGQDMIQSDFIAKKTNLELVEFIKAGGVPNETRVMPPKGGQPWLTDENLSDIVAYLRSLQK